MPKSQDVLDLARAVADHRTLAWAVEDEIADLMPSQEALAKASSDDLSRLATSFYPDEIPELGPVRDILRARRHGAPEPTDPEPLDLGTDEYIQIHKLTKIRRGHERVYQIAISDLLDAAQDQDADVLQEISDILPPSGVRKIVREMLERRLALVPGR